MEGIAERLREARNDIGISQEALGVAAEIHQSQISMLELSKYGRHLTLAQAVRVCAVLGVTVNWLATGKDILPAWRRNE